MQIWQILRSSYRGEDDAGRRRVAQLDTVRGGAVLLIFYVHYCDLMGGWLAPGTWAASVAGFGEIIAHSGTDLFFTLSGYLIYASLMARERPLGRYIVRRFGRIYPTFLFVVGVYLVIFFLDPPVSKLPPDPVAAVLYILANLALLPGVFDIEPIVAPAWALSYLAVFYISAPLLVRVLQLRRWQRLQRAALFLVLAVVCFAWGHYYGGHVRFAMFLGGMLLYEFRPGVVRRDPAHLGAVLFLGAAAAMVTISALSLPPVIRYITLFVFFPLASGACLMSAARRGPLTWQWLQYLGRITLSYIMIHGLTLQVLLYAVEHSLPRSLQGAWLYWSLLLPAFAATAVSAALVFALVEQSRETRPRGRPAA